MQGFGVEPKPRPNGQSVSALVMGIGVVRTASRTGRRSRTLPSFPSGRNEVHLKGLRRGVRPGRVHRRHVERYDFIWLLMSATEGNEEVKDGFLAVLVVLSEGKLNPAASPPRPLFLCPPSVSHFKLQESHQLQLLLFACVLDHRPGRCPANSGGYLVLSFHFLKGPFEYSSTLKQCAICPSFSSRNAMLRSMIGLFLQASIITWGLRGTWRAIGSVRF